MIKAIEKAIEDYVKDGTDESEFTTGWIVIAAVSSSALDKIDHNGYVSITSDGLPHHAQLGLLAMAMQDKQAGATVSSFYQVGAEILNEDEWEDEDE